MTLQGNAEIFEAFRPVTATASGRHVYDFTGSATRVTYKRGWQSFAATAGRTVKSKYPPKNEHYLDWVAMLQSVARASGTFRMAELGAGWAPWTVRAALASRQIPGVTALELLAIEADPTHYEWMIEHFRDNGLDPSRFHLLHGAASPRSEMLRFPVISEPDVDYGASVRGAAGAAATIDVKGHTVAELLSRFSGPLDFLHVDIQGAEYECLPPAMDVLSRQVKSVMIGTHLGSDMHATLANRFREAGWVENVNLVGNRAHATPWGEIKLDDGFLHYDNPCLH